MSRAPVFFDLIFTCTVVFSLPFFDTAPAQPLVNSGLKCCDCLGSPSAPTPHAYRPLQLEESLLTAIYLLLAQKFLGVLHRLRGEVQSPWPGVHGISKPDSNVVGFHLCHFLAV